jgi:hypothetical protein
MLDISKNMEINVSIFDANYGNVFSLAQFEKKNHEQDLMLSAWWKLIHTPAI